MIQQINNKTNTDRAWRLVYTRLQEDGLIPVKTRRKTRQTFQLSPLKWAAAILVAGVCCLTLLQRHKMGTGENRLSLHNEKGAVTLVTTLEDGSIVYLAGDTQLSYPEHFTGDKREVSLQGEALFDVQSNRERPFLIQTRQAQIEVRGTAFSVQSTEASPWELSVRQGEVKVTLNKNGRYLYARAGQTVTLDSDRLQLKQTPDDSYFSRYSGHIRFKDEKLSDILRVINTKGSGPILQATPALENKKITVTFADDTPESVAGLICIAFNLICKRENNTLLISEP